MDVDVKIHTFTLVYGDQLFESYQRSVVHPFMLICMIVASSMLIDVYAKTQ